MSSDRRDLPAPQRVDELLGELERAYPDARIALDFTTPLECVVATLLSAQSTDKKINEVTSWLFKKYRTPEDYLTVPEDELKEDLKPTGFFNQKTKAVRNLSQKLLDDFDGEVPATMAELITLPGVARKTANIVQSNCFPEVLEEDPDAGIAVDTHVGRVAVRLGLTEHYSKDAPKIERDLMELFPREKWPSVPNVFIIHGRTTCDAKRPRCEDCPVEPLCPSSQEAGLTDLFRVPQKKTAKKKPAPKKKPAAKKKPATKKQPATEARRRPRPPG